MNTKINLGSGHKHYEGFLNLDDDPSTNPDFVVNLDDINLVLPFEDDSISEIRAEHILEHIGTGFFRLMQEIYRVCKDGAFIQIVVPHPFHETYLADPTHRRPILPETMRLFSKKYNQYTIDSKGSASCLGMRYGVDFEIAAFDFIPDSFYRNIVERNTEEQNVRLFREANNVCLEIHIVLVVVKNDSNC